ncbi:hypothetical protein SDC9_75285 [bioreactor metagenome]|uniref:Gp28/Gp37-like domain-containing protein n=1 Tax=bioreactor metagenome TaxID=1076179 RepID=A0A644YKC8_9ZZZZ
MDRTSLKILNKELEFIGDIEDFKSFYFIRSFFQAKEFQLVAHIKYANILNEENYIYISKKKVMIIEEIEIDEDKEQIVARGRDLKTIISDRVTVPPTNESYDIFSGTSEEVIKHYVEVNCISPRDPLRKIENLVLGENLKRGQSIKWQSRYKNLGNEIESIGRATGLGWFIYLDHKAKKIIFDVESGIDRTSKQNQNSRVIFSGELGNITNTIYKSSSVNYKNVAYVGGQGEGAEREIKEVTKGNYNGIRRKEVFVDARDISETESLQDRGLTKLSEYEHILNLESTINNNNLIYEKDWDLGDIVTIKNDYTVTDQRVTEVREIYEEKIYVEITIGNVEGTVIDNINSSISNIPNEGGSSSSGGDKSYEFNQLSPKKIWNIPHGLNKRPSVTIVDSGGTEVKGDVKYDDNNNATISFTAAFAGIAYLN